MFLTLLYDSSYHKYYKIIPTNVLVICQGGAIVSFYHPNIYQILGVGKWLSASQLMETSLSILNYRNAMLIA